MPKKEAKRQYERTKPAQFTARLGNVWVTMQIDERLRAVCRSQRLGRADVVRAALEAELARLEAPDAQPSTL